MVSVAAWLRERGRDGVFWPRQLVVLLPGRLWRLRRRADGPSAARAMMPAALFHAHAWLARLFDLAGGLELLQIWLRLLARTAPLTTEERAVVGAVLGEFALRYDEVRVATGGWLRVAFRANGRRAFAIGHTIFLPEERRSDLSLLLHELVHTCQYERLGSRYIGEALYAQRRLGRGCYDYGGAEGLAQAMAAGWLYASFNREAQAQIVQDYWRRLDAGKNVTVYETFVAAARRGAF
ncbi:MAG: DUF4157 domain-containing protein [Anaerolineae bacterium]|nr:DUF4157 domain-containing protein [Anaerolineae bacterium]